MNLSLRFLPHIPCVLWLFWIATFSSVNAQQPVLPPVETPPWAKDKLSAQQRVFVREFRFEGNKAISTNELARVVAPFVSKELTSEQLEEARRAVTLHYVNRGYINSGAVLPDQTIKDGIVRLKIVEGALSAVNIKGNRWLSESYIKSRAARGAGTPLNMNGLRDSLQVLRENPNVKQVNAELKPGVAPGESVLDVQVKEQMPLRLGVEMNNYRPPSVGSEEILLNAAHMNLTGHNDPLSISYGIAHANDGFEFSGLNNFGGSYTLPLNAADTTLSVFGSRNDFAVIEEPFNELDIESESHRYGLSLRHPVWRSGNRELALAITGERRHSETFLLGEPFSLSPGAVDGETDITAVRFVQEWTARGQNHVFAVRSTLSWGVDAFHATDDGSERDAKFFSWLGQVQYLRRLFDTPAIVVLRADAQWTGDQLLAMEQFSVGGATSVRGYRENQLVRDRAVISGVEVRVPVWTDKAGNNLVQLAPFFDFGGAWNVDADNEPETITSAGIGLMVTPNRHVNCSIFWGHRFREFEGQHGNVQDLGIHFRLAVDVF